MFATIILISTLCNVSTAKGDSCDGSFEQVWSGQTLSEFKSDGKSCLNLLDLYPDVETVDKDHVITRDCYIADYDYEKTHKGKVIVQSMTHPANVFVYDVKDLEVK